MERKKEKRKEGGKKIRKGLSPQMSINLATFILLRVIFLQV